MNELKVTLPPEVPSEDARVLLAIKLFETGRLSLGQASALSGFSKRTFMEILGKAGVPVFNHPPEDLEGELRP
jgi:predicted HTH domain antitoxin